MCVCINTSDTYTFPAMVMAIWLICVFLIIHFLVPTIQKLGLYLEKVTDWEAFGYQLLPEAKEHLIEVTTCTHYYLIRCSLLCKLVAGCHGF